MHTSFPTKYPFPPLLACKIFSRFLRSLGRAPWNSFSNFSWKKIPCTFYAPWCKKWCLILSFTTQTSGFTSLINYWRITKVKFLPTKSAHVARFTGPRQTCFPASKSHHYPLRVSIHATYNTLICYKTGLNLGGETRSVAFQLVLQQCFKTSCQFVLPILP